MKKFAFLLFIFLMHLSVLGQDTLRNYNPSAAKVAIFGAPYIMMARFVPGNPISLKKVLINVDGLPGDSARLRIFGHEGGAQYPQRDPQLVFHPEYLKDIIPPIHFELSKNGSQIISLEIPGNPRLNNNQFFIAVDQIKGLKLYMSGQAETAYCSASASQGGAMQWQLRGNGASISGSDNPLIIDCIVTQHQEKQFLFENIIDSIGIPDNTSSAAISVADINNDAMLDIAFRNAIYFNDGNGKFENQNNLLSYSGNAAANVILDVDNDSKLDILSLDVQDSSFVYKQCSTSWCQRQKVDGIPGLRSLLSFSVGDISGDGLNDIFLSQLWGAYPVPYPNFLLTADSSNSVLKYNDESQRVYPNHDGRDNYPSKTRCLESNSGTWLSNGNKNRRSRGSVFFDFDNDGDLDLYVSNYFLEPDELHENNGTGVFNDISSSAGVDRNAGGGSNHGTGVDAGDLNNDGLLDLITPQFAHPGWTGLYGHKGTNIYLNTGGATIPFDDKYGQLGVDWEETHAGASLGDVNNDGLLDIFIKTFYGCRYSDLYLQQADGSFENKSYEYGLHENIGGNDAVFADIDSDGLLDLITGNNGKLAVYKNKGNYSGSAVEIQVFRNKENLLAIGSKVYVHAQGKMFMREIKVGQGQKMQSPYCLHFGLGNSTQIDSVVVVHPNKTEVYKNLEINKRYNLYEDNQTAQELYELKNAGSGVSIDGSQKLENNILVYPNPFSATIHIVGLDEESYSSCSLYNLEGKLVFKSAFSKDLELPEELSSGIYFLRVTGRKESHTTKLIKE